MCVQLEDYSQVYDSVQAYASGAVRIWIGTSNTMYAFYNVIPQVGLPGPSPGQTLPHSNPDKSLSHSGSWSVRNGAVNPF